MLNELVVKKNDISVRCTLGLSGLSGSKNITLLCTFSYIMIFYKYFGVVHLLVIEVLRGRAQMIFVELANHPQRKGAEPRNMLNEMVLIIWQYYITVRCTFGYIVIMVFYKYYGALHL